MRLFHILLIQHLTTDSPLDTNYDRRLRAVHLRMMENKTDQLLMSQVGNAALTSAIELKRVF
jgi:hypothetical protein